VRDWKVKQQSRANNNNNNNKTTIILIIITTTTKTCYINIPIHYIHIIQQYRCIISQGLYTCCGHKQFKRETQNSSPEDDIGESK
jgi:hypothetical protein